MDDRTEAPTQAIEHFLRIEGREPLRCIATKSLPPGPVFELAAAMKSGDDMAALAVMWRFIETVVVKDEHAKLRDMLYDTENVITFDQLNVAIGTLMKEYAQRPTPRPSSSAPGRSTRPGTSRVVSLSRGTVRDEPSSTGGNSVAS